MASLVQAWRGIETWEDLLLSSDGTVVMTVVGLVLVVVVRFLAPVESTEEVERIQAAETARLWARHNRRWVSSDSVAYQLAETSSKPPVLPQKPLPAVTRRVVDTAPCPTSVTVVGELASAKLVYVTVHDVGLNHSLCFGKLQTMMNGCGMLEEVAVVNVDFPGHEDGATRLPDDGMGACNLEQLSRQLHVITQRLEVPQFVGIGAGVGANVLLRFAADRPSAVAGLVLANPSLNTPSRSEAWALRAVAATFSPLPIREWACANLSNFHFSARALACTSGPRAFRRLWKDAGAWDNRRWLIEAARQRDAIDDKRVEALVDVPMLLFSADQPKGVSPLFGTDFTTTDTQDLRYRLVQRRHQRVSHIKVRGCGSMLTEERPEELLRPIKLFVCGCGVGVPSSYI